MEILDQKRWDEGKAKNTDAYGARIFSYAEDWANFMEDKMAEGAKLEDVAEMCARDADTDGISGFMYGAAVATLSKCWKHGDQLRRWHNLDTQIGNEGEKANEGDGTLNPAMLNIGKKGVTNENNPRKKRTH